jgi:hypothetical protein
MTPVFPTPDNVKVSMIQVGWILGGEGFKKGVICPESAPDFRSILSRQLKIRIRVQQAGNYFKSLVYKNKQRLPKGIKSIYLWDR